MIIQRTPKPDIPDPFDVLTVAAHCRLDANDTQAKAEAGRFAMAAALEMEGYAAIALLDQVISVTLDRWPRAHWLALPIAPLIDLLSVSVLADGQPFDAFAITTGQRPEIRLTEARPSGPIVIEYDAGFGSLAADIPQDLALAIMDQAMAFYDNRGAGDGKTTGLSPHAARVAARYRRVSI